MSQRRKNPELVRRLEQFAAAWPAIVKSLPYGFVDFTTYRLAVEAELGDLKDDMEDALKMRWAMLEPLHQRHDRPFGRAVAAVPESGIASGGRERNRRQLRKGCDNRRQTIVATGIAQSAGNSAGN